jgi:superfamily II DNA or RNA helicase
VATFDQFIASLERDFGEQGKGKSFEVFCKWFLENDPEWSAMIDKVWLWDDYPDKWQRQDLGTDLVFRDSEGLIWAVQAKCYSEHRTTSKGDLNSFLADTGRKEVNKRLWIQTTNKMEARADKTIKGQEKPVTIFQLNDFRKAQIEYPESFAEIHKAKVKKKPKPDPHQLEAIQAVQVGLQSLERGQLIMACGTGKTFTTLWIKEALGAETALVLLPSLNLLSQTMREWAWAKNHDFDILNVCSDKSVGKKTEDMNPRDAAFPVTSDVEEISRFLKKAGPKVLFCTYQSSDLIAQVQADTSVPTFDLAIADEAHRCAGKADAGFATILDGNKIRATKRLFTTATPRYFGKAIKDEANARSIEVIGMENEDIFGPVVHKLSFGEAIHDGLLTDYQVVIVGVDEPMVKEWIDNYEIVSANPNKQHDARTLAAKIGLIKAIKDYDLERVISFHSNISKAREFSEELPEIVEMVEAEHRPSGAILSNYVSGEMKAGDRKDKIEKLKKLEGFDRGILTNARCLAEGVDVPSLDGVAFIDPRGSQVDIIQAVGRAIRKVRGAVVQKKGTIVIPVFIEDGDDPEASIEASNFKPVWDVLKALRSHDDDVAEVLDTYRTNMAKNASQSEEAISAKVIFDLPQSVGAEFVESLRTVLVEATTTSWEFWFGLLEQFKQERGHCRVPKRFVLGGVNLGFWVATQRQGMGYLSPDRKKRLDDIGFVWDAVADAWDEGFSKLVQFKEQEAHCRVPASFNLDGFRLGIWVSNQRAKQYKLSSERRRRLDGIGFVWDPNTDRWEEGFSKLLQFKELEGHCRVPQRFKLDGFNLGRWVATQRSIQNTLPPDRKNRLSDLGFVWDAITDQWEEGYRRLLQFKEREDHCRVPDGYTTDGFNLGNWVAVQRRTEDKLLLSRKTRLDELGFVWDPLSEQWEEGFGKLVKFKKQEGHCKVPQGFTFDGYRLGVWVSNQRANRENMPLDRRKRLDDIGFVWNALKQ